MVATKERPKRTKLKMRPESNGNGHPASVLDVPVEFGNVTLGDGTARLGIKISRDVLNINAADETLCERRLTGKVVLGHENDSPGQTTFVNSDYVVEASFDTKRYSVGSKTIATGLTVNLKEIDVEDLSHFSKKKGRMVLTGIGAIPGGSTDEGDDEEDEEGDDE